MEYVYKYVDDTSRVVYVGITNDMKKRVYQHKADKLKNIKNPIIYYFPVKYRADAEMLETYLIDYYKTGRYYNVSKTKKGNFSFLDICESLPWTRFTGKVDIQLSPFVVSMIMNEKEEIIIEKPILVDKRSTDGIIIQYHEDKKKIMAVINDLIDFEETLIDFITSQDGYDKVSFIVKGLYLHKKRLLCARLIKKCFAHYPFILNQSYKSKFEKLMLINDNIKYCIEQHESKMAI